MVVVHGFASPVPSTPTLYGHHSASNTNDEDTSFPQTRLDSNPFAGHVEKPRSPLSFYHGKYVLMGAGYVDQVSDS